MITIFTHSMNGQIAEAQTHVSCQCIVQQAGDNALYENRFDYKLNYFGEFTRLHCLKVGTTIARLYSVIKSSTDTIVKFAISILGKWRYTRKQSIPTENMLSHTHAYLKILEDTLIITCQLRAFLIYINVKKLQTLS